MHNDLHVINFRKTVMVKINFVFESNFLAWEVAPGIHKPRILKIKTTFNTLFFASYNFQFSQRRKIIYKYGYGNFFSNHFLS